MASKQKGEVMALFSVYAEDDEDMEDADAATEEGQEGQEQGEVEGEGEGREMRQEGEQVGAELRWEKQEKSFAAAEGIAAGPLPRRGSALDMLTYGREADSDVTEALVHSQLKGNSPSPVLAAAAATPLPFSARTTPAGAMDQSEERETAASERQLADVAAEATPTTAAGAAAEGFAVEHGNGVQHEVEERGEELKASSEEEDDVLNRFLPSPPREPCPEHLQLRFTRYWELKQRGISLNEKLRSSKGYRNPLLMQQVVEHEGIFEHGSCLATSVFDPRGLPASDFFDELLLEQRRTAERKQKGQVEFLKGGVQMPAKPVVQIMAGVKVTPEAAAVQAAASAAGAPMASAASSGQEASAGPAATGPAALKQDNISSSSSSRSRHKSKWDKVSPEAPVPPVAVGRAAHLAAAAVRAHAAGVGQPAGHKSKEDERSSKGHLKGRS